MQQQSLSLSLKPHTDFASFFAGSNRLIVKTLNPLTPGDFIYLWGASGLGVSHLLQATCSAAAEQGQQAIYIDLAQQAELGVEMLEGLEHVDVIALDHIEAICGITDWEQALFHLYNRCQALHHSLLIGAHAAPIGLPCQLADLVSRFKAMLILQLKPLSDTDKLAALQLRAQQLGLSLSAEVGQYLLSRTERGLPQLFELLTALDHASLRAQRKLTIPFIKDILARSAVS
jgi:DnaA-homolog protein